MTLLPEVEHALLTAIRAGQPARSRRQLLGPVATVAMVSVTLVVFVGALVLLHHHAGSRSSGGGASRQAPSTRQTLLSTMGVLRRPPSGPRVNLSTEPVFGVNPTAPLAAVTAAAGTTVDRRLVRTSDALGTPYVVKLMPTRVARAGAAPPSEQLRVAVAYRHPLHHVRRLSPVYESGLITAAQLRSHGVLVVPSNPGNPGVLVVPDGVAEVTVGPRVSVQPPPGNPKLGRQVTLPKLIEPCTADVSDNVAPVQLGTVSGQLAKTHTTQLEGVPVRVQTTWFAANGRVIAQPEVDMVIWVTLGPRTR